MRGVRQGFTLIELSIVLVIIGLISGAILVGRDLIRAAELRQLVKQVEQYELAVNVFRGKYNCLPGDCDKATEFGLGEVGGDGDDGDGDGHIAQTITNGFLGPERSNFWYHLGKANMISTTYPVGDVAGINSPPAKLQGAKFASGGSNGGFWIVNGMINDPFLKPHEHAWTIVSDAGPNSHSGVYLPEIAGQIDLKLDDGYPLTGRMVTITSKYIYPPAIGLQCTPQVEFCAHIIHLFTLTCINGSPTCSGNSPEQAMIDDRVSPPIYNIGATNPTFQTVGFPIIKSSSLNQ